MFCDPGALAETVRFYEALTSVSLYQDMDIPEAGLHVVAVGAFLILELDREKLGRYDQAVETHATVLNADLDDAVAREVADGAEVVQPRSLHPSARELASGIRTACSSSTSSTAPAPTTSANPALRSARSVGR